MSEQHSKISRRDFLTEASVKTGGVVLATAALAQVTPSERAHAQPKGEMKYRTLGRTNLRVSEIGCGAVDAHLIEAALERGVNYVDTSGCCYGPHEEAQVGPVVKRHREKLLVATKFNKGHFKSVRGGAPKTYVEAAEGSLRRLQTDHIDLIQLHDFDFPLLRDEELLTAVERLKRDGKVRFFGVTTHNIAGDMRRVDAAVNCDLVDTILTWINPLTTGYQEMLKKAKAKNLGVIAMKTGGSLKKPYWEKYEKHAEYRRRLEEFDQQRGDLNLFQCAIAWALEQEGVSMALVGFSNFQEIEEDVKVSGVKLTAQQRSAFERLAEAASPHVCRWCRACESACPQGLPIADILRYRMYAENYGRARARQAERLYAQLPAHPDFAACAGCRACERACPYGLRTVAQLQRAHEVLA